MSNGCDISSSPTRAMVCNKVASRHCQAPKTIVLAEANFRRPPQGILFKSCNYSRKTEPYDSSFRHRDIRCRTCRLVHPSPKFKDKRGRDVQVCKTCRSDPDAARAAARRRISAFDDEVILPTASRTSSRRIEVPGDTSRDVMRMEDGQASPSAASARDAYPIPGPDPRRNQQWCSACKVWKDKEFFGGKATCPPCRERSRLVYLRRKAREITGPSSPATAISSVDISTATPDRPIPSLSNMDTGTRDVTPGTAAKPGSTPVRRHG